MFLGLKAPALLFWDVEPLATSLEPRKTGSSLYDPLSVPCEPLWGLVTQPTGERQKAGSGLRVLVPHLGRTDRQELLDWELWHTSVILLLQGRQGQDLPLLTECLPLQGQTPNKATTSFTDGPWVSDLKWVLHDQVPTPVSPSSLQGVRHQPGRCHLHIHHHP